MLNRIIEWSARNVFIVLLGTFFVVAAGVYSVVTTPVDAIPDLSDVQVIVYTEYPGQAPQVIEDQVTYPLTTAMLGVPKSKVVRGLSVFGASFVYIIFEDDTDIYWARSRVLEYLNYVSGRLPRGVTASLGPDATGVGWVYQYAVLAKNRTLEELRTIQDWFIRYQLTKAHGVSEIASVGGFVKQYQVTVNPRLLQAYGVPLMKVMQVIRDSNRDVGGRVVELAETEYVVRGRGYLRGISDITLPAAFAFAVVQWEIPARSALIAYLWAWLENQVMAALKSVPLGQTDGQRLLLTFALGGLQFQLLYPRGPLVVHRLKLIEFLLRLVFLLHGLLNLGLQKVYLAGDQRLFFSQPFYALLEHAQSGGNLQLLRIGLVNSRSQILAKLV